VRVARQVSHPNVCRVHDLGESEHGQFISMEHVAGEDLGAVLRRLGRLTEEKALDLGRQICAGLAAAHAAGVLHRDLKPANVLLDAVGNARLTDFGLAVLREETGAGFDTAGTPAYMAPERIAGAPATEQSDLYALGVLLFELLTGRRPVEAHSLSDLARVQREAPPPPPSSVVSGLSMQADAITQRCLALDPKLRPSSALEVLTALSGGDALQAALAAGQTPSPETVAAAGSAGALRPATAWACFLFTVAALLAVRPVVARIGVAPNARLTRPPEVLAARAQELIERLGFADSGPVASWEFAYDREALRYRGLHAATPDGRPATIVFWYRRSAGHLFGGGSLNRVSADDPPLAPGEAQVVLDPEGRLLRFTAVPAPGLGSRSADIERTSRDLAGLAGLEAARLEPEPPVDLPPAYADTRAAWRTAGQGADPLRLDVALLAGRPVHAAVTGPWSRLPGGRTITPGGMMQGVPGPVAAVSPGGVFQAVMNLLLAVGVVLAGRNLRKGRGDLKGAARLGIVILVLYTVRWLFSARHVPVLEIEMDMFNLATENGLDVVVSICALYLALEPYVRRLWPQSLVSWSRLLMGHVTDPMVARDVLVGLLTMNCCVALSCLVFIGLLPSGTVLPVPRDLSPLMGLRFVVGGTAEGAIRAIVVAAMFLLCLLVSRLVGQRRLGGLLFGFTAMGFGLAWWGQLGLAAATGVLTVAMTVAVFFVMLTRLGLLAAVVAGFVVLLGMSFPDLESFSSWYASIPLSYFGINLALAAYGLYFSVGKEPLLPWGALDR
jgi:hypothetical protein